jgi:hypothetical protein
MPVAAFVLLAGLPVARADDTCPPASWVKVVELSKEAKTLLDARHFDDALGRLRTAYGICPGAKLSRSMGRVYDEADRPDEALAAFESCAREADTADLRMECTEKAVALKDRLGRGLVRVEGAPAVARVYVDLDSSGRPTGEDLPVTAGRHDLEVRAEGYRPFRTTVVVPGGKTEPLRIQARLEPVPDPPEATPVPPPPLPLSEKRADATWNWIGVGLGSAATITGIAFLGIDIKDRLKASDCPAGYACRVKPTNLAIGVAATGMGVAAIVASAVLWPRAPAKAGVFPVPGGGAVAVEVGF